MFFQVTLQDQLTWLSGKSPCSIGNTSSTGPFSIAMLVYQRVHGLSQLGVAGFEFHNVA